MFLQKGSAAQTGYEHPGEAEKDSREITRNDHSQRLIHEEGLENIVFRSVSFYYVIS